MDDPPQIFLTERDLQIVAAVAVHRLLDARQIQRVAGGSAQQVLRRLQLLYHHGFLDRLRRRDRTANRPLVYQVAGRGRTLLSVRLGMDIPRQEVVKPLFIEHTLLVAEILTRIEAACRQRAKTRFIASVQIIPAERDWRRSVRLEVSIKHNGRPIRRGVVPDALFGLEFDAPEGRAQRAFFFVEADRGHMPNRRLKSYWQNDFFKKLVGYYTLWHAWRDGRAPLQLPFRSFRVLTVTTSAAKVANLISANKALNSGQGSRIFLFTDRTAVESNTDVLSLPLLNGRGEATTLAE